MSLIHEIVWFKQVRLIMSNCFHGPTLAGGPPAAFCGRRILNIKVTQQKQPAKGKSMGHFKHTPIPKVSSLYTLISSSSSAMACRSPQSIFAPSSSLQWSPFSGHSDPFSACGTDGWRVTLHQVEGKSTIKQDGNAALLHLHGTVGVFVCPPG